ncbi:uncharacterized protein RSE6_10741 [Rhynchosporium secalis]|uniref:BZIP domain-containing protein n=1 Tax=Rhynchosporium secalis TaxID=38038 RepID=A0A1E1ML94_RHYSE|nr:uncharacterized protein RSE6_10741 [Rhynchosporium secalis]
MASQHLHPGFQQFGQSQAQTIYPINNHQPAPPFYQGQVYEIPPTPYGTSFRGPGFEDEFAYNGGSEASFHETSSPDMVYPYDMSFQCSTSIRRDSGTTSQEDDEPVDKISSGPKRKRTSIALDENQRLEKRRIGNMVAARKFRGKRKDELETLRQMYSEQVDKNAALQAQLYEALSAKYQLSIELVEHLKMKQQKENPQQQPLQQQQQQQQHQHQQQKQQSVSAMQSFDGTLSEEEYGRCPSLDWSHSPSDAENARWPGPRAGVMGMTNVKHSP